jgi:hypothetical protein
LGRVQNCKLAVEEVIRATSALFVPLELHKTGPTIHKELEPDFDDGSLLSSINLSFFVYSFPNIRTPSTLTFIRLRDALYKLTA